jgi:hypothetical protein
MDLDAAVANSSDGTARKLLKAVEEFHTDNENNKGFIPNYGERYRHGERISTGFVESTVNQVLGKRMVKKQQMAWTQQGAHLLLQIRTRVLNGEWKGHIPGVVPRIPTTHGRKRCCMTPRNLPLSIIASGLAPLTRGYRRSRWRAS